MRLEVNQGRRQKFRWHFIDRQNVKRVFGPVAGFELDADAAKDAKAAIIEVAMSRYGLVRPQPPVTASKFVGHFIVLAAAAFILGFAACMVLSPAYAHSGGLAKDMCHNDRKADERHWHDPGTRKRGGPCITEGGITIHVLEIIIPPPNCMAQVEAWKRERDNAFGRWRNEATTARAAIECLNSPPT